MVAEHLTPRGAAAQQKAAVLREALPWITRFHGSTIVVKYGGNAMVDERRRQSLAADIALLHFVGLRPVVVHGGGPQISELAAAMGIESRFAGGLRVTDNDMLQVVRMALLGQVNPDLVGLVQEAGAPAVGVAGTDASLFRVVPATGPAGEDIGLVGEIDHVDTTIITELLEDGFVPVVATIGRDETGQERNVNADLAAGALAAALGASKLVYLTDVPGLYLDFGDTGADGAPEDTGSLISEVSPDRLEVMLASGSLHDGMLPKIRSILDALEGGVSRAHILDGRVEHAVLIEMFTDEGIGTMVVRDAGGSAGLTLARDAVDRSAAEPHAQRPHEDVERGGDRPALGGEA